MASSCESSEIRDAKLRLEKVDESLRKKYLDIVLSLDTSELRNFGRQKHRYKKLVMSEMFELVPEIDKQSVDDSAQYISNMLANEAQRKWAKDVTQQKNANRRRTRSSLLVDKNENTNNVDNKQPTAGSNCVDLTETFINDLEETLTSDPCQTSLFQDSQESSFSATDLDDTYENDTKLDDSVTRQKTVAQSRGTILDSSKSKNNPKHKENRMLVEDDDEIQCVASCAGNCASESIRCNLCMTWFHTNCVGISDLALVGAWVCADCRVLPRTVQVLETKMETLLKSTEKIFETINSLAMTFDNKFQNLNDKITSLSNQNKLSEQSSTSSLSELRQEVEALKIDIDKKSNQLLSKTQSLCDRVKSTPDLTKQSSSVSVNQDGVNSTKDNTSKSNSNQAGSSGLAENIQPNNQNFQHNTPRTSNPPKVVKRDLTLVTGSDAVTYLEPKFLGKNVRIKSFKNATIQNMKDNLSKMDLSRYLHVVLHIGGHDVDANISKTAFQESYKALVEFLVKKGCKVFISGLLPRGGTDMKPYNSILKNICNTNNTRFIDNHDSFVLASGELPSYLYHADMTNLRFPGIQKLVHNINGACAILPSRHFSSFQGINPSEKRNQQVVNRHNIRGNNRH